MAHANQHPLRPITELSHAELYLVALDTGMTFEVLNCGSLCIGTGLLGYDRERTVRVATIDREMRRRGATFTSFAKFATERLPECSR